MIPNQNVGTDLGKEGAAHGNAICQRISSNSGEYSNGNRNEHDQK